MGCSTDRLFTGQRLDETGLYFYNARYYDATIGRFISPDTIIPQPRNPQAYNRYTYCFNNPLRYVDPSGHLTGTVTINGVTYTIVDENDGNGNHHLKGPGGDISASMTIDELLSMIGDQMEITGDYGFYGNQETGLVITVYVQTYYLIDSIPVRFVSESWIDSYAIDLYSPSQLLGSMFNDTSIAASIMTMYDKTGISVDFQGGAFIRLERLRERNKTQDALTVSGKIELLVYHECYHYYEQVGSKGGFGWYWSYVTNKIFQREAEERAIYWAEHHDSFYNPAVGWSSAR